MHWPHLPDIDELPVTFRQKELAQPTLRALARRRCETVKANNQERRMVTRIVSIAERPGIASKLEEGRLSLHCCKRVLRLEQVKIEHLRPFAYERIVLPLCRLPGIDLQPASPTNISAIAKRYGLILGRATEHIRIVRVTPDVALHLAVAQNHNVLELSRVTRTTDGVPIEWRMAFVLL